MQVQAQDDNETVSRPMDDRFQQGVDAVSMLDGSGGTDDYLMAWEWGDFQDVEGSPKDAAEIIATRYELHFPKNFVARIRDLHRNGNRDPQPGAVDHWLGDPESTADNGAG